MVDAQLPRLTHGILAPPADKMSAAGLLLYHPAVLSFQHSLLLVGGEPRGVSNAFGWHIWAFIGERLVMGQLADCAAGLDLVAAYWELHPTGRKL